MIIMKKKRTFIDLKTKKEFVVDEDNLTFLSYDNLVKMGRFGRQKQYKYFCEHPEEIEDEKLFSELEEEFGDVDTKEIN